MYPAAGDTYYSQLAYFLTQVSEVSLLMEHTMTVRKWRYWEMPGTTFVGLEMLFLISEKLLP